MFPRNNVSSPINNASSPINNASSPSKSLSSPIVCECFDCTLYQCPCCRCLVSASEQAPYDPNQDSYHLADFDGTHIGSSNGSRNATTDIPAATSPINVRWSFTSHVQSSGAGSPVASSTTLPKTALNKPGGPSRTSWAISTNNASSTAVASVPPGDQPGEPSKDSSEPDDSAKPAKPEERKRVRIDYVKTQNGMSDPYLGLKDAIKK
jgi:hypothetical protein